MLQEERNEGPSCRLEPEDGSGHDNSSWRMDNTNQAEYPIRLEPNVECSQRMDDEIQQESSQQLKHTGPRKEPEAVCERLPPCHNQSKLHKKSFVDDLTLIEKISLKNLIQKNKIIGPLNFHDRFNLGLPRETSILQHQLEDLKEFTLKHHMKINSKKTRCLLFNNSETRDFLPQFELDEGENLEVIYELKLVGLVLTSDLSWNKTKVTCADLLKFDCD